MAMSSSSPRVTQGKIPSGTWIFGPTPERESFHRPLTDTTRPLQIHVHRIRLVPSTRHPQNRSARTPGSPLVPRSRRTDALDYRQTQDRPVRHSAAGRFAELFRILEDRPLWPHLLLR